MALSIEPTDAAVLALDFENDVIAGAVDVQAALACAQQVLKAARQKDIPVIFVKVAFSPDYIDAPPNAPVFQMARQKGILQRDTVGTKLHPSFRPLAGEMVLRKTCVNPFISTNLQQQLTCLDVNTLIVMGLWTNLVVESTTRHAADMGYHVLVVREACASNDRENHEFAMDRILPMFARVCDVDEVLAALGYHRTFSKRFLYEEDDLASKGASVQRITVKAHGKVREHRHAKTTEVYSIVRGTCRLYIGNREYLAGPGDVFIAKPGQTHSLKVVGDEDLELIMFTTNQEDSDVFMG